MNNSSKRVLVAVLLLPVVIYCTYAGGHFFAALIAAIALISQWEYLRIFKIDKDKTKMFLALFIGLLLILSVHLSWSHHFVFIGLGIICIHFVFSKEDNSLESFAGSISSLIYPVALLSYLLVIRNGGSYGLLDHEAFRVTITAFVGIWLADTGGYYVGRSLGNKPMAPVISPKKTWEGFAGGVLFAAIGLFLIFHFYLPFLNIRVMLAWILIASTIGPIGDLAESKLKRSADIKDSSNLIPGHGGMLDRFDAMIIAAPFFYLSLSLLR